MFRPNNSQHYAPLKTFACGDSTNFKVHNAIEQCAVRLAEGLATATEIWRMLQSRIDGARFSYFRRQPVNDGRGRFAADSLHSAVKAAVLIR